jgi:hypothetical protein
MNETRHLFKRGRPWRWTRRANASLSAVAAVLVTAVLWGFLGGCSDDRKEPLNSQNPAYTETIPLWTNATSDSQRIAAPFNVAQELAPIVHPGQDSPARLTIVCYISADDSDITRLELIQGTLLPRYGDTLISILIPLLPAQRAYSSWLHIDSLCDANPDSCHHVGVDTALAQHMVDSLAAVVNPLLTLLHAAQADTAVLNHEAAVRGARLDNRYTLALWMDQDTAETQAMYPQASFRDSSFTLGGQAIYAARTDSATQYKACGLRLNLDRFLAADRNNLHYQLEVNWTTCFTGSQRPCLSPGQHTLYARLTGAQSRITASLVLVYSEVRP